jgi:enhancing lycopene biosynthesis protein 2
MAKRVAVVLSGCGAGDGSDVREAMLVLLALERTGTRVLWAAPDVEQTRVVDHRTGELIAGAPPRRTLLEAARIGGAGVVDLASVNVEDVDAVIFPGGRGVGTVLSNFDEKGGVCDVHPDVVRLLKGHLATHRPMGFIGLASILAARVLGPVAGVHVTLGLRHGAAHKHAAVMGADIRPCPPADIFVDKKNRVISTPSDLVEEIRPGELAAAIEKLVRTLVHLTRDRSPAPQPEAVAGEPGRPPVPGQPRPASPGRPQPAASQGGRPQPAAMAAGPRPGQPFRRPGGQPRPQQGQQQRPPQQGQQQRPPQPGQQQRPPQQRPPQQRPPQQGQQQRPPQRPPVTPGRGSA